MKKLLYGLVSLVIMALLALWFVVGISLAAWALVRGDVVALLLSLAIIGGTLTMFKVQVYKWLTVKC